MDKESLLTVIIFTYNHKNTIAKCIESIVNQKTDYKYEIHICDDASFDGTADICREYGEKYPDKIKLFLQEKNTLSVSLKDNHALSAYKRLNTKYWCYIDGDDWWCDENKVRIALDFLEKNPEYYMFGHKTKVNFIDKNQKSYMPAGEVKNPVTCGNIFIHPSARICRGIFDYLDNTLLGDSIIYNIWLLKGPLFYYDKAMSVYNYNLKGTWSRLDMRTKKLLNLTIPYRVLQYHKFKKYYKYCLNLLTLKKDKKIIKFLSFFLGMKLAWQVWFAFRFVPHFGFRVLDSSFNIYSNKTKERERCKKKSL